LNRYCSALILCILLLSGCQSLTPQVDTTAAGQRVDEGLVNNAANGLNDGLGGTGQKFEDGIGGTGIVGTVTEFGSIWVNNARVHFDQSTPIKMHGKSVTSETLKIGQVVAVLSDPMGKDYRAKRIDIVHEVVGPITNIQVDKHKLTVLNQIVLLDTNTKITTLNGENNLASLQPDDFVQVSGLRKKDGSISATRMDQVQNNSTVQLIGELNEGQLSGMAISIAPGLQFDPTIERLLVRGHLDAGVIHADSITKDAILEVIELSTDLLLEGFLFNQVFDGDLVVGGVDIVLPDAFDMMADFDDDEPIYIEAALGDDDMFYSEGFMFMEDDGDAFLEYYPEFDDLSDEELDLLLE